MKNFMLCVACVLLVGLLFCGVMVPAEAQESEQQAQESAEPEASTESEESSDEASSDIPDPSELGPWWLSNALKYDPIYPNWLFRAQIDFSYNKTTGNTSGYDYSSGVEFVARKNRFSSYVDYSLSKNETTIAVGGATTKINTQVLVVREQIDLLRWLSLNVGMSWERDSPRFLLNRYSYFGGFHLPVFDKPRFLMNAGLYYGYVQTEYANDEMSSIGLPTAENFDSGGVLFRQFLRYSLTPTITFIESFNYMKLFDDDDSYRWRFTPIISVELIKPVSVFAMYDVTEEDTPIYEAIKIAGAEKRDTSLVMGFSIQF
ncbi:MAG: DUF481 domain-containing protein [bacterium]|nr:DUF481 domain-containing protein [bacterium]